MLSKVAERIPLAQFNNFLRQKKRHTCHQSGNRKHHSTETLSLLVSDHIFSAMDKKQITAMVLIGLSKALDSLCHYFVNYKIWVPPTNLFLQTDNSPLVLQLHCQNQEVRANMWVYLRDVIRDGPLEKLWGGVGEFSSRRNFFCYQIPCMNFFRP